MSNAKVQMPNQIQNVTQPSGLIQIKAKALSYETLTFGF
jgi:hypothetical protein